MEGETPLPRESAEGGEEKGRGHVCGSQLVPHLLTPQASHRSPPRDGNPRRRSRLGPAPPWRVHAAPLPLIKDAGLILSKSTSSH